MTTSPADKAASAWKDATPTPPLSNFTIERRKVNVKGDDGEMTTEMRNVRVAKPLKNIAGDIIETTGGFPKSCRGALFGVQGEDVTFFNKADDLFGYLHDHGRVQWSSKTKHMEGDRDPVTKSELFSRIGAYAERVEGIEQVPHIPKAPKTFYCPCAFPENNGSALEEFMGALNADTDIDRGLMLAALLTPAWGGPPGTRPAFLIESKHMQGSGKTSTAIALSQPYGGCVHIQSKEKWETARSRLLDDDGLTKRICILDNVKHRLVSEFIESVITMPFIDGHRMYTGQFSRPNRITWFVTANDPQVSTDIATRAVVIRIGKQKHNVDFVSWLHDFMAERHRELLADILELLRQPPVCTISPYLSDRFNAWQSAILGRIEDGGELAEAIIERRKDIDSDREESVEVLAAIHAAIDNGGFSRLHDRVYFERTEFYTMLDRAGVLPNLAGQKQITRWLKGLTHLEALAGRLEYDTNFRSPSGGAGRWIYNPPQPTGKAPPMHWRPVGRAF